MLTVDYDRLGLVPGEQLLDLGCGAGRHAYEALRRGAHVVACDLDAGTLKDTATVLAALDAEGSGCAVNGDALALPFGTGAFDRVIASEILEHVRDDITAIAELARVLRQGGVLAVTVPRFGPELVMWALSDRYHEIPGGHVRIYRLSTLLGCLRTAGFEIIGVAHTHGLHTPYWWLRCAVGVERDDHVLVRACHQLLVADIERRPVISTFTRAAEALLNPFIGKSLVVYARLGDRDG